MTLARRRQRVAIRVGQWVLGGFLIALALFVVPTIRGFHALERGSESLYDARGALAEGDIAGASRSLDRAEVAFAQARGEADGAMDVIKRVPVIGGVPSSIGNGASAGRHSVMAGRALRDAVDGLPLSGRVEFSGEDLGALRTSLLEARPDLSRSRVELERAVLDLQGTAKSSLPPVAGAARRARRTVTASIAQLDRVDKSLMVVADLLDPNQERRLLFLSQDTLELRPTGGFIGSLGVIRLQGGAAHLERFGSYEDLPPPDPPLPPPAPMGSWIPRAWDISNSNWWPDFPRSASVARDMFMRQGGGEVDGVVAMTELLMTDLLEVFGPIKLPDYAEPVEARGLDERIVYEVELKSPQDVPRKKFLIDLSQVIFERLTHLPPSEAPAVFAAIARAAASGDLQVYLANPQHQQAVSGTALAGEVPVHFDDFLMLVDTNRSAGKANKDLTRHATYRVRRQPDGGLEASLTLRYANAGVKTSVNPWYFGYLRIYVPRGSALLDANPAVAAPTAAEDGPYDIISTDVFVNPEATQTLTFRYRLPSGVAPGGQYVLTWVRQAGTPRDTLTTVVGGQTIDFGSDVRVHRISRPLGGNRIMDFLRSRWVWRRLTGSSQASQ